MSYANGMHQVQLADRQDFATATGVKGAYSPGIAPVVVRAAAVLCNTEPTGAGVVQIRKIDNAGAATVIATINIAAATNIRDNVYKVGLNTKVSPTELLDVNVSSTVAGLTSASCTVLVEPSWEEAANLGTKHVATT